MSKLVDRPIIEKCRECTRSFHTFSCSVLQTVIDPDAMHPDCPLADVVEFKIGDYDFTDDVTEDIGDYIFKNSKDIEAVYIVKKRKG